MVAYEKPKSNSPRSIYEASSLNVFHGTFGKRKISRCDLDGIDGIVQYCIMQESVTWLQASSIKKAKNDNFVLSGD